MKKCSCCKIEKSIIEFYKNKSLKDGLSSQCKICYKQYHEEKKDIILKKQKIYYDKLKEKEKPQLKGKICSKCKEYKAIDNYWISNNSVDGVYSSCKKCQTKTNNDSINRTRIKRRKYQRTYYKNRISKDPVYRLKLVVHHNILCFIRKNKRNFINNKIERLRFNIFAHLEYTINELKQYIESLWESWMSWENYGLYNKDKKTWQIDHIIPQSKLPFTSLKDENFKKCWNLKNLQPLETIANIKKGNYVSD
jgi:hypothetical protein